jgi:hypothetical protein
MAAMSSEDRTEHDRLMAGMAAEHAVISKIAVEMMERDPRIPYISAFVIAQDMASGERNLAALREGKVSWLQAEAFTGSYARMDLRVRAFDEHLISFAQYIGDLPEQWTSADPDDTDERFLTLWHRAHKHNKYKTLRDRKNILPPGPLTIYRGQDEGAPFGIAWSLAEGIAGKFARGAATRQTNRAGVIYAATVERTDVLGYMTGRNEREVIVNPRDIHDPRIVRRFNTDGQALP